MLCLSLQSTGYAAGELLQLAGKLVRPLSRVRVTSPLVSTEIPFRSLHTTPAAKSERSSVLDETKWRFDPSRQLFYSGKPLSALPAAQRAQKPVISDSDKDMVTYTHIKEMSTVRTPPILNLPRVNTKKK
jgi:hypothetical protein